MKKKIMVHPKGCIELSLDIRSSEKSDGAEGGGDLFEFGYR